ncbi:MAG: hypothetical protein JW810_05725 [Sedimentisphaerales bacterium]|nr:hypothetical protein [Sedimentisphaerales bacterium]
MRLAIGHYFIGSADGVNTVIHRTVNELLQIDPDLEIVLFGKAAGQIQGFLPWDEKRLTYLDIEEMSPDYAVPGLEGKSIESQQVHDYVWHGTNIAEILRDKLQDVDVVLMENLSVGVNPAVTYAFYLWTQWEYHTHSDKRFLVRVHDFAQQRPANFSNIKKFQAHLPSDMPDWHQILYPSAPNIEYIVINTNDYYRLLDHGLEPIRLWYVPNGIDPETRRNPQPCSALRQVLQDTYHIDPEAALLFYPVRAIPRKNVEEAIFLTCMLNRLADDPQYRSRHQLDRRFHLVVSLGGASPEERRYTQCLKDFVRVRRLPVTIDIGDVVALQRQEHPDGSGRLVKYGVADMYSLARMTVTTSVLEGFGFVFMEPWLMDRGVIGRNIPSVTMDFTKSGLSLDHLYSVLLVNGCDYADLGGGDPDGGLSRRLEEIYNLDSPEYLRMVLQKNSAPLRATLKMFGSDREAGAARRLIRSNRQNVLEHYSCRMVVAQLHRIMCRREPTYLVPRHNLRHKGFMNLPGALRITA